MGLPTDLIPLSQACRLLPGLVPGKHLNVEVMRRWCRRGKLNRWRLAGRWFVSRREVLRLMEPDVPPPPPAVVQTADHEEAVRELAKRGLMVG